MTLVVDASIAAVWFLPDEATLFADKVLQRVASDGALVPDLFWHEMRNVLTLSCRRQRLSRDEVRRSMLRLTQLNVVTATSLDGELILDLAERHRLTAYDAAYLALAIGSKLPLATLDKQLIEAAARENVPLLS